MGRKVLVVEDHADTAGGLAELLTLWGHDPHVAASGEQAIDMAGELAPDVLLVDIELPGMDGHEVARRLRRAPGGESLLLVALTGYESEDTGEFAASGFDRHLRKPLDLDALERLLDQWETRP